MMNNNDKTIRSAFEEIIPPNGARERMLKNIKRKAKEKTKPGFLNCTKFLMPAAACLVVGIIAAVGIDKAPAVSQTQTLSKPANSVWTEEPDATFAEELGISIEAPEGAINVKHRIIDDSIADISFEYSGIEYTLRASKKGGDFSGISGTAVMSKLIGEDPDKGAVLTAVETSSNGNFLKLEWNSEKTKYYLICPDNESSGNSPDIKNSGSQNYPRTEKIIDVYGLIK